MQTTMGRHAPQGARWAEREGRERILSFGAVEREYGALDDGCALFDLSDRGLFSVSGEDRARFLNGLLTQDVARLTAGTGCHACQLNRQSRVLSDLRIYDLGDRFLVETEPGFEEEAQSHLQRYKIADRVAFETLTHAFVHFSLQGPGSERVVESLCGADLAGAVRRLPPFGHLVLEGPHEATLLRVPRTGRTGVDVLVRSEGGDSWWKALERAGATPAGWLALEAGRIEAGLPRFGADFGPDNLFMEVGLADAVSFDKGCYVGQEIVARVRSRGHVNRCLAGLLIEGEAASGDRVWSGESPIGKVTSRSWSPRLGLTVAMGLLQKSAVGAGDTTCFVGEAETSRRAKIAGWPLVEGLQP